MSFATKKLPSIIGVLLLLCSLIILIKLFFVPVSQEFKFLTKRANNGVSPTELYPPNTDYSIVIPKLGAAAPIVKDVDSLDPSIYQRALTKGVAHANGTANPGENGNIFLFAHSSADLFTASRYNSVFYLVHHLDNGDEINLWYQGIERHYQVISKEYVSASDTEYLTRKTSVETLTLMTCWPPGTTYKRLIIEAIKVQ